MAERIETPPTMQGDEKQQLEQMWRYLYQLSEAINSNLDAIGGNDLTDAERKTMNEILNSAGISTDGNGIPSDYETLKSLIIKTADFVQTKLTEYRLNLLGETVASGQFGRYVQQTGLDVVVTPTGITQNYSFREIVQDLKQYEVNAKNYIKTGLLRTVDSLPVYGVAIGKDIVTFSDQGVETYNDGNKVAELTAEELSFWQNGNKIASYTGTSIIFFAGDSKRLELSGDGVKIYKGTSLQAEFLGSDLKFYSNGTLRSQMDTNGVSLVNGSTKLAEFLTSALKFYYNGTLRTQMDTDGVKLMNGNTTLAEFLTSALKFYYNGTLRSQMDSDGLKIYNGSTLLAKFTSNGTEIYQNSQLSAKFTGTKVSFYYSGTEVFYIENGKIFSANDMELDSSKKMKIGPWELTNNGLYGEYTASATGVYKMGIAFGAAAASIWYERVNLGDIGVMSLDIYSNPYNHIPIEGGRLTTECLDASYLYVVDIDYHDLHQQSSRDIKHDIQPMQEMGETLDALQPVTFIYDDDPAERRRMGLIYEDTIGIMPEICSGNESHKSINYIELIPALLKEIQALRARVAELERR